MNIKNIEADYFVSEQITVEDLDTIKAEGFQSIICNRPDGEVEDQPTFNEIKSKAEELKLEIINIPIEKTGILDEQVESFQNRISELPKPVLAYCRSGMRSTSIWALANSTNMNVNEIIDKAASAGYDLSSLIERIQNGGKSN